MEFKKLQMPLFRKEHDLNGRCRGPCKWNIHQRRDEVMKSVFVNRMNEVLRGGNES